MLRLFIFVFAEGDLVHSGAVTRGFRIGSVALSGFDMLVMEGSSGGAELEGGGGVA